MSNRPITRHRAARPPRRMLAVTATAVLAAGACSIWVQTEASAAAARTVVVAVTGQDSGAGTLASPYATVQKAVSVAQPGDTIAIRGGTYALTTNITISRSGTAQAPISMTAYQGERVVIDGEALPASHTPVGGTIPAAQRGAIHMSASFWRISSLELTRGPYGVYCDGCNDNVFDRLVTRDNYETGFQLQGASARNLIVNLDSYLNHDPRKNGESADGLGIKQGSGSGNVVRGARLWNNVDDGLDLWDFSSPVTVEGSLAYGNGVNRWNFPDFAGDGNGFKLGGGSPAPSAGHVLDNDMAYRNVTAGFTDNGNPGAMKITRSTAWKNEAAGFNVSRSASTLTANLSVNNASAVSLGTSSKGSGNSWDLGGTWNDARLQSTDPSVVTGPRTASGAIPASTFLVPTGGLAIGAVL